MTIFSKLFGSSKEREIKSLITETHKQIQSDMKPVTEVGLAIIQSSTNCRDAVKGLIDAPTEKERQEREIYIFYEFIYFYMHMTLLYASAHLEESQMRKLQTYLGPLISSVAIDSYFAHWPDDLKEKMKSEFYDKLNQAELEYSEWPNRHSAEPADGYLRSLFMKLGSNIAALAGNGEKDIAAITPIVEASVSEYRRMRLDNLMGDLNAVIENLPYYSGP